jgi:hypothetical protein
MVAAVDDLLAADVQLEARRLRWLDRALSDDVELEPPAAGHERATSTIESFSRGESGRSTTTITSRSLLVGEKSPSAAEPCR